MKRCHHFLAALNAVGAVAVVPGMLSGDALSVALFIANVAFVVGNLLWARASA